jgi:hypothetical protein
MALARHMSSEQVEKASQLIEARKGRGCVCVTVVTTPIATQLSTEIVGTIGDVEIEACSDVCLGLRR